VLEGAFGYLYGSIKQLFTSPDNVLLTKKNPGTQKHYPQKNGEHKMLGL